MSKRTFWLVVMIGAVAWVTFLCLSIPNVIKALVCAIITVSVVMACYEAFTQKI